MLHKTGFAPILLASSAIVLPVQAGGLWLTEFNQPTKGRAGAGEEAGNGDASDAFFNPASMSRHAESKLMVNGGLILPNVEFDVERGSFFNGAGYVFQARVGYCHTGIDSGVTRWRGPGRDRR